MYIFIFRWWLVLIYIRVCYDMAFRLNAISHRGGTIMLSNYDMIDLGSNILFLCLTLTSIHYMATRRTLGMLIAAVALLFLSLGVIACTIIVVSACLPLIYYTDLVHLICQLPPGVFIYIILCVLMIKSVLYEMYHDSAA